jgi:hypothetical protein
MVEDANIEIIIVFQNFVSADQSVDTAELGTSRTFLSPHHHQAITNSKYAPIRTRRGALSAGADGLFPACSWWSAA